MVKTHLTMLRTFMENPPDWDVIPPVAMKMLSGARVG
jgi:hypothetical protein